MHRLCRLSDKNRTSGKNASNFLAELKAELCRKTAKEIAPQGDVVFTAHEDRAMDDEVYVGGEDLCNVADVADVADAPAVASSSTTPDSQSPDKATNGTPNSNSKTTLPQYWGVFLLHGPVAPKDMQMR